MQQVLPPDAPAYVLEGWQQGAPVSFDCESIEDAIDSAYWGRFDNSFAPRLIKNMDGDVVIDEVELDKRISAYKPH